MGTVAQLEKDGMTCVCLEGFLGIGALLPKTSTIRSFFAGLNLPRISSPLPAPR